MDDEVGLVDDSRHFERKITMPVTVTCLSARVKALEVSSRADDNLTSSGNMTLRDRLGAGASFSWRDWRFFAGRHLTWPQRASWISSQLALAGAPLPLK